MLTSQAPILTPVVTLVAWTLVMWLWMYMARLPAMQKAKMKPDPQMPRGEQMNQLPARARWKADNYNHLMEQPTVFFAVALALALMGEGSGLNLTLAWAYVIIRIIHSIFQATVNKIEVRFLLFVTSNIPLFWLTINALMKVYG